MDGSFLIISLRGEIWLGEKPDGLDPLEVWIPLGSGREKVLEDPEVQELVSRLPETVLAGRKGVEFTPETYEILEALWRKLKEGKA